MIKLKRIYKHFLEKAPVQVKYRLFQEICTLILKQISGTVLKKKTSIIQKNNTYNLTNMDFINNVQEEEQKLLQLTRSFYHIPDYEKQLKIIER